MCCTITKNIAPSAAEDKEDERDEIGKREGARNRPRRPASDAAQAKTPIARITARPRFHSASSSRSDSRVHSWGRVVHRRPTGRPSENRRSGCEWAGLETCPTVFGFMARTPPACGALSESSTSGLSGAIIPGLFRLRRANAFAQLRRHVVEGAVDHPLQGANVAELRPSGRVRALEKR